MVNDTIQRFPERLAVFKKEVGIDTSAGAAEGAAPGRGAARLTGTKTDAVSSPVRSSARILGRGALSLRLRAQALSHTGRGGRASASVGPATGRATTDAAVPVRVAQALGNSTSPGTGEVASSSEPERALSRSRSGLICNPLQSGPAPCTRADGPCRGWFSPRPAAPPSHADLFAGSPQRRRVMGAQGGGAVRFGN